jgi:hypothetical protein
LKEAVRRERRKEEKGEEGEGRGGRRERREDEGGRRMEDEGGGRREKREDGGALLTSQAHRVPSWIRWLRRRGNFDGGSEKEALLCCFI